MFRYYLILILIEINVNWKFRGFICKVYYKPIIWMCSLTSKKYVKSQIPAANTPTQIEVLEGQLIDIAVNESKTRLKRGRSVSAKDRFPGRGKHKKSKSQPLKRQYP
jgi:hypothetical protein